jgi:hypothetical protein
VSADDVDGSKTLLVVTTKDVATSTEDQEVMNQVKDLKTQVLLQNNKSRFSR